jgi:hypothetical protein
VSPLVGIEDGKPTGWRHVALCLLRSGCAWPAKLPFEGAGRITAGAELGRAMARSAVGGLPESIRITSSAKRQLSRQARMFDRSFFVGMRIETGQSGACMI